jgi:hypothetical protein
MQMCGRHWQDLLNAIEEHGLDRINRKILVASDVAHEVIVNAAIKMKGLEVLDSNEDGSWRCPLCFAGSSDALIGHACRQAKSKVAHSAF